jgi:hypothetical protein
VNAYTQVARRQQDGAADAGDGGDLAVSGGRAAIGYRPGSLPPNTGAVILLRQASPAST